MTDKRFKLVDDYTISYDGDYFDLHKPSHIKSLVTVIGYITEENERLLDVNAQCCNDYSAMRRDVLRYKGENEQLKQQLYYDDEEGVCNICKHHYLVKDDELELGYYHSRCRKGHYECARVSLKYCEDFEKELKE